MSTQGRHSAPKARPVIVNKVRMNKLPAIALAATLTLTSAVAVVSHGTSASSETRSGANHSAQQNLAQSGLNTKTATKARSLAATRRAKIKSHSKAAIKARAHMRAVARIKSRAKAKARAHMRAVARTRASVNTYVSGRSSLRASAATRSRTIQSLRGQVASLKSQLRTPASVGPRILAVADNYGGVPYVSGGTSPRGFDCSGYTQYVYGQLGISLPRVADAQSHAAVPIRRTFAKPGDLVFYHSGNGYVYHVAIYAGGNMVWHAPHPGRSVERVSISSHNVTFGRVSASATQNAIAITLAHKSARLAHLIHNK